MTASWSGLLAASPCPSRSSPWRAATWTAAYSARRPPRWRSGVITDNGNQILDVHGLMIDAPEALESAINQIAGVVSVGLFAARPADLLLVGTTTGVERI